MSLIGLLLPILVIASNAVLKNVGLKLFSWVGFEKHSDIFSMTQNCMFVMTLFNTGISILLINANFNDQGLYYFFNGQYSDFSDDWYRNIANLFVTPMILQWGFPITSLAKDFIQ